jgi:hypothetical protein
MADKDTATKTKATTITVVLPDNRKFGLAPEMARQDAETIRKALRGAAPEIALSKVEKDETDAQGHRTLQFVKEVTRKG